MNNSRGEKMVRVMGIAAAAALAGLLVIASPASAQGTFSGIEVGNVFQVTDTVTTTAGVTSTADLTGTTGTTTTATTTSTSASGSVLLPQSGADLLQQQGTTTDVIPLLLLIAGIALMVAVVLMSFAKRDYRRQDDKQ